MSRILVALIIPIYIITIGFSIYAFILFIKLARRGIKALDIYIEKENNQKKEIEVTEEINEIE